MSNSMSQISGVPPLSMHMLTQYKNKPKDRKPIKRTPLPGKVYFIPNGRHFPNSIIHDQKQDARFFLHPVMVFDVQGDIASFYSITKTPPIAIRELNMAFRLGINCMDAGPGVLRLVPYSNAMPQESWVNLEQRLFIEWENLDHWAFDVQVDIEDFGKIIHRVSELEAEQNRYIYKPLLQAMSGIMPGMVIMKPNQPGASTFGAPILVVENKYPAFLYLNVKRFQDNINFNPNAKRPKGSSPRMSLAITKQMRIGHCNTPVLVLEQDSPDMREESYVEVEFRPRSGMLDTCKTWCWPPVRIDHMSMVILRNYTADAAAKYDADRRAQVNEQQQQQQQQRQLSQQRMAQMYPHFRQPPQGMAYQTICTVLARSPLAPRPNYGAYYQPPAPPPPPLHCRPHSATQQPEHRMGYLMPRPAYPAGNHMYSVGNNSQHLHGEGDIFPGKPYPTNFPQQG